MSEYVKLMEKLEALEIGELKNEWKLRDGSIASKDCAVCSAIGIQMEGVERKEDISLDMQVLLEYVHNFHLWYFCSCHDVFEKPTNHCCGHRSGMEQMDEWDGKVKREDIVPEEMCMYHQHARAIIADIKKQGTHAAEGTWCYENVAAKRVREEIENLPKLTMSDRMKDHLACIAVQHISDSSIGHEIVWHLKPQHSCDQCKNNRYRWDTLITSSCIDDFCKSYTFLKQ
jgi:hypothetical protein